MYWARDGYEIDELAHLAERLGSTMEDAERASDKRSGGQSRRRSWVLVGAPLALTIIACAAVLFAGGSAEKPAVLPDLTKAAAIDKIAGAAELGALPFPTVNQYLYTMRDVRRREGNIQPSDPTDANSPNVTSYRDVVSREENWMSFYREGALRTSITSSEWASPRDEEIARRASIPGEDFSGETGTFYGTNEAMGTVYIGGESVSREELADYPTDPREILKRINATPMVDFKAGPDNVWASLVEAMHFYALPPKLRAGMVETAGLIPGVRSLGPKRDKLGRQGYAFSFDTKSDDRQTVLLDPKTAMVLHFGVVSVKDPNKVLNDTTLIKAEVVEELPAPVVKKVGNGRMPAAAISQANRTLEDARRRDAAAIAARKK